MSELVYLFIAVGAVAFAAAALWPFLRAKSAKSTLELQQAEITARDSALERIRADMAEQERRCTVTLQEQDRRHTSEIGELRGQLTVVTASFAETIARAVIAALPAHLREETNGSR